MPNRSQNRRSVLTGPLMPVPVSPIYGWWDTWHPSAPEVKIWYWTVPNDGMSYKLCNFEHVNTLYGWHYARVDFNDETVFDDFNGYQNVWRPAYEKAPSLSWPDVITVYVAHYPSYAVYHYWEMDFWREKIHGD